MLNVMPLCAALYGLIFSFMLPRLTEMLVDFKQAQRKREIIANNSKLAFTAAGFAHALFCIACGVLLPCYSSASSDNHLYCQLFGRQHASHHIQ